MEFLVVFKVALGMEFLNQVKAFPVPFAIGMEFLDQVKAFPIPFANTMSIMDVRRLVWSPSDLPKSSPRCYPPSNSRKAWGRKMGATWPSSRSMTTRNSLLNQPCLRKFKTFLMSSRKFKHSWWRIVGVVACAGFWRQQHQCAHDINDVQGCSVFPKQKEWVREEERESSLQLVFSLVHHGTIEEKEREEGKFRGEKGWKNWYWIFYLKNAIY